jgi:transposase-like protein
MSKLETRALIRMWIEEENLEKLSYFRTLGSEKGGHYTDKQKDYAIDKAISIGVRATSRLLKVPRRTIQRWLRAKGITVKRCPDWVYDWAYWRNKRREKWERIRAYRGY